jgi:uroporphyrinogen decarboxylase
MNGTQRMCAAIRRETPDRVPTFEWFIDVSVGKALTGSDDPLDVVERLDIDGVNIRPDYGKRFIDSQIFEDEWGCRRQLTGDSIPAVIAHPVADLTRHREFSFPDPCADDRFATLRRAVERFGDTRAVDSAIKRLRAKLREAAPEADNIEAVRGVGYRQNP